MGNLRDRYDLILLLLLFLLAVIFEYQETFSLVEDETLSYRQLLRSVYGDPELTSPSEDIVILYTDEEFYTEYDKFPLKRVDLATIVARLSLMGTRVIAVDLLLDFNSAYGEDGTLSLAFEEAGNVLLVSQAEFQGSEYVQLNRAIDRLSGLTLSGYSNITPTSVISESITRLRVYPEIAEQEEDGYPFAFQAVAMFLGAKPELAEGVITVGDDITVPLDQFGDIYIDYALLPPDGRGGLQRLHDVIGLSALDVLFVEDEEELEDLAYLFEDKIVLIGEVAEVAHDEFETPLGNVYGVEIIANTIASILRNAPLQPASVMSEGILALAVLLGLMVTTFIQEPARRNLLSLAVLVAFIGFTCTVYIYLGVIFSISYIVIAGFLGFLVIFLKFYLSERGQKALIREAFGQYLSPKVVSDLLSDLVKDPENLALSGEEREMTAFFSDIEGFSSFSENLSPTELVALLNEYLTEMCNIIIEYDGTVDKYEGDAIIAFWGAPTFQEDHARRACFASIDMNELLKPLREKWKKEGKPVIKVRMGINSGEMRVGNMGSAQRMNYTMMGDSVNLASRLEGANKAYKSDLMISEYTYAEVRDDVDVRELDTIRVVGRTEPVTVYQLLERKHNTGGPTAGLIEAYDRALTSYKNRDFVEAAKKFRHCLTIVEDDGPSQVFVERCQEYVGTPPEANWDGIFTLTDK